MTTENDGRKSNHPIGNAAAPDVTGDAPGGYKGYNQTMPTLRHRRQEAGQRRAAARVNAAVFAGYVVTATTAVALKAWETIRACDPDGWLGTANVIIWDAITLYGALGALALGVREMVLAYFMRKDYEAEIDTLLRNQEVQAEIIKAMRDMEFARQKQAEADHNAIREQNAVIQQLLEQNRQLLEIVTQQRNGSSPPAAGAEPPDQPEV